jgi:hypothetical protein
VRIYGPTVLSVRLPHRVWIHADDLTIFAVASPYRVLPLIPRYLVPHWWWRAGFRYGHVHWAFNHGFVYEHHGHYYIHGDIYHVAHYIHRDFYRSRHCRGRVAIGHTDYRSRDRSHVRWSRGYRSSAPDGVRKVFRRPKGNAAPERYIRKPASRGKGGLEHRPQARVGKGEPRNRKITPRSRDKSSWADRTGKIRDSQKSRRALERDSKIQWGKDVKKPSKKTKIETRRKDDRKSKIEKNRKIERKSKDRKKAPKSKVISKKIDGKKKHSVKKSDSKKKDEKSKKKSSKSRKKSSDSKKKNHGKKRPGR